MMDSKRIVAMVSSSRVANRNNNRNLHIDLIWSDQNTYRIMKISLFDGHLKIILKETSNQTINRAHAMNVRRHCPQGQFIRSRLLCILVQRRNECSPSARALTMTAPKKNAVKRERERERKQTELVIITNNIALSRYFTVHSTHHLILSIIL